VELDNETLMIKRSKGKPEPLKYDLAGLWSRRIDQEHRLVCKVQYEELFIYACKYHCDK
jgi:toxin YoeB